MLLQAEVEDVMILIARLTYFQFQDLISIILETVFDLVIYEYLLRLYEPLEDLSFQDSSAIKEAFP